jgi:TnpA family transposase
MIQPGLLKVNWPAWFLPHSDRTVKEHAVVQDAHNAAFEQVLAGNAGLSTSSARRVHT